MSRVNHSWQFRPSRIGVVVALLLLSVVVGCLLSLVSFSGDATLQRIPELWNDPYYRHVTQFSFYQAALSTLLSVGLAIPFSVALARRSFWGKRQLLKLFSVTLVLPVLVAVYGIIAIYGNRGQLAQLYGWMGQALPYSLYGLNGILIAHVFFNFPYATRLLLSALDSIPYQHQQLSLTLGMTPWQKFKLVQWPRLKQQLPHVSGLVFMLCFTSFATVMALGGGPKATTIELAIYQAIKFDFELDIGALLALWQMLLCGLLVLAVHLLLKAPVINQSEFSQQSVAFRDSKLTRVADRVLITVGCLFVLPPLLMVLLDGIHPNSLKVLLSQQFWQATLNSLTMASASSVLAVVFAYAILHSARQLRHLKRTFSSSALEVIGGISLVTPGLVISTGLFLLLRQWGSVYQMAFIVVIVVNSMMALPFALKSLSAPMHNVNQQYHDLMLSLGVRGYNRAFKIELNALKPALLHAFAVSFLLSLGDLTAIALFGSQDFMTLPLYLLQLLGSYQMDAAATVSLWLLILSVGLLTLAETRRNR